MRTTIKKWNEGNLQFHVFHEPDDCPDLSYLEQDYSTDKSISKKEAAKYRKQDQERLEAYHRGEWYMTCVGCEISIATAMNWAVPTVIDRAYLGGVESDNGDIPKSHVLDLITSIGHAISYTKAQPLGQPNAHFIAAAPAMYEALQGLNVIP